MVTSPIRTLFKLMRNRATEIVAAMRTLSVRYTWEGTEIQDHLSEADWKAIDAELSRQMTIKHDRGLAITYCALVENRLQWLMERQFRSDLSNGQKNFFFKGAGPLASAFSQTKFLHALGVFDAPLANTIFKICEIRNKFAHTPHPVKFSDPKILDLCEELRKMNPAGGVEKSDPMQEYGLICFVVMTALLTLGQRKRIEPMTWQQKSS